MNNNDIIRLSFPINPAYVSSARLTASSVANRVHFDIDEIEDIKTAVSEACTYIIKRLPSTAKSTFEICFQPGDSEMRVEIVATGERLQPTADDMSIMMIKALMDEFDITQPDDGQIHITMVKRHTETRFE